MHVGSVGESQTVTFDEAEITPANIVIAIEAATNNVTATVTHTDYVTLSATNPEDSLTIEASGSTALTVLGLTGDVTHAITAAAGGTHTGSATGAKFIADAVNTDVSFKVGSGASQPVSLTAGAARTIDQILAEINSGTTDLTASKQAVTGYLVLTADDNDDGIEVEAVSDDAVRGHRADRGCLPRDPVSGRDPYGHGYRGQMDR